MEKNIKQGLIAGVSLLLSLAATPTAWTNNVVAYENHAAVANVSTADPCNLAVVWTLADGQSIKGFVNVATGLTVAADATASVDTFGLPVHGVITLGADSTLSLPSGLYLAPDATLAVGDAVDDEAILLATGDESVIYLGGDFTLPASRTVVADGDLLTIDGKGNVLAFGDDDSVIALELGTTLRMRNLTLDLTLATDSATKSAKAKGKATLKRAQQRSPFKIKAATGTPRVANGGGGGGGGGGDDEVPRLVFENCIIIVPPDLELGIVANDGYLDIAGDVILRGGGYLEIAGAGTFTIDSNSVLRIEEGSTFSFAGDSRESFVFTDATSVLHLNNATFYSDGADGDGALFTKGTVIVEGNSRFNNGDNNNSATSIAFGDGTADNDVALKIRASATLGVAGVVDYNNVDALAG